VVAIAARTYDVPAATSDFFAGTRPGSLSGGGFA
jgi:hypothetical protein